MYLAHHELESVLIMIIIITALPSLTHGLGFRAGQGRAGQGRAGQGRAGQGRAGHAECTQGAASRVPGMLHRTRQHFLLSHDIHGQQMPPA